jgi:tetratricopeptide (TPR) repeat protein/predicted Ser/Thr protein kinase
MIEGVAPRRPPSEFHPDQPVLPPGTVLSQRYEIMKLLGEGGMGAVYKAKDRELNRVVALKTIRPEMASNPSIIQRFKQELILARQVTHKNVIRIFDLGEDGGLKFITMEFVQGEDLREIIQKRGKLPPSEAVGIMVQVCRALDAAHSEDILHRDLKPQNIMIDAQGRVIVMDFGLARSLEMDGMTQTGALVGTMEYMSPEQALGATLDQRSDIFTLGLIFYELLSGKLPFSAETALASLVRRTQERAAAVSDLDRDVPRTLSNIVSKCLERDLKLRYASVQQLQADLEAWLGNKRPSVSSVGLAAARWRTLPWKRVAIAVIAISAAIGATWYFSHGAPKAQVQHAPVSVLVADFKNTTGDSVFDGTLEPAFSLTLEGAPFINTFGRGQAHRIGAQLRPGTTVVDDDLARLIAAREGLGIVIGGSIASRGSGYRISSDAIDVTSGKVMASDHVDADGKDDVLRSVGKLAIRTRKALGDVVSESKQAAQIETYTSSSLEAAHEYAVAQELQSMGTWEGSVQHYQRAIELDPNMGRAYAGLATVNANMGRKQDAEKYYQLAMSRIDRMSDREKYRTRGGYFLLEREPREAIQEYSALVKQYPADLAGYSNMALAYFYLRDMPKALQEGRKAVEAFPKFLLQRNNLALYAIYAGDFATGEKEATTVLQQNASYANAYAALAMAQLGQGKVEEAKQTYQKLAALSPRGSSMTKMGLADLALYQGRADEAIPLLEEGVKDDIANKDNSAAATKLIALAQAYLLKGERPQAVTSADHAITTDKNDYVLHAAGVIFAQAGQDSKAASIATQLDAQVEPEPQLYGKLLDAEIALLRHDPKKAIELFKQSGQNSDTWLGHLGLGRAYLEVSAWPEADAEFENCLKRRGEVVAIYLDDVPTFRMFPQTYYYLGRAQDGLKSPAAADSYRTFVEIQKEGTGPLLADARKHLAAH